MEANPTIYQKGLAFLGINENHTLIGYSNNKYFMDNFTFEE